MSRSLRSAILLSSLSSLLAIPSLAYAQPTDGVYGRLDGDLVLSIEAGGGLAVDRVGPRGALSATARIRALDMGGFFVGYQAALGGSPPPMSTELPRGDALAFGVELRPLPFARIFNDLERGPQWWDLTLDSLGLELGAALVRPGARWQNESGFAFLLGGGFEFPLYWQRGNAITARLSARWQHSLGWDAHSPLPAPEDSVFITVSIVGRLLTGAGIVRSR